mgnify:CR=1 FL=1
MSAKLLQYLGVFILAVVFSALFVYINNRKAKPQKKIK